MLEQHEQLCLSCNGNGKVKHDYRNWDISCEECEGRGSVLTDEGRKLLEFIGWYLRSQDSDVLIKKSF